MSTPTRRHRETEILAVARAEFLKFGYGGFSVRQVALGTGIALSTLQHYFRTKDALLAAMLLDTFAAYHARVEAGLAPLAGAKPIERFTAGAKILLAGLRDPSDPGLLIQLWAMALKEPGAATLVRTIHARERHTIRQLLSETLPSLNETALSQRADAIVSLIEGLLVRAAIGNPLPENEILKTLRLLASHAG